MKEKERKSSARDMTQGSPMRLILGFALPMMLGFLFQQFYNMADTVIVGRFLGVNALAAVGATGSVNFFVIGFCMGILCGEQCHSGSNFWNCDDGACGTVLQRDPGNHEYSRRHC